MTGWRFLFSLDWIDGFLLLLFFSLGTAFRIFWLFWLRGIDIKIKWGPCYRFIITFFEIFGRFFLLLLKISAKTCTVYDKLKWPSSYRFIAIIKLSGFRIISFIIFLILQKLIFSIIIFVKWISTTNQLLNPFWLLYWRGIKWLIIFRAILTQHILLHNDLVILFLKYLLWIIKSFLLN